jgi:phthalate 4,5-dioxygenase oxygenase subunit
MTFNYLYRLDRPFTQDEINSIEEGGFFPPLRDRVAYGMPDGTIIDTYLPRAKRENDYEISRDVQRAETFTGIRGANDQDRCLQENMRSAFGHGPGRLVDRSGEHLVASDRAGIMTRRMLLRLARELQNGIEPRAPYDASLYRVRAVAILSEIADFATLRETHKGDTHAIV